MSNLVDQYLSAAETALGLLAADAVREAWEGDSALAGFSVGGLAGHVAAQLYTVAEALEGDYSAKERIGLFEHFERAAWVGADLDNAANTKVREGGQRLAEAGHEALVADARTALDRLAAELPARDGAEASGNPHWKYATSLDDFLVTRIMEFVVHADDLACSVRQATPEFDPAVFDTAVWLLGRLSVRRHGQAALVRALARSERAPGDITAL